MAFELLITEEAVCLDKAPGEAGAKVVACTSPEAAYQLVGKGAPISAEDAARHGVKTKPADLNYTLRLDSHTIARTPEEKAYAATQPQPFLVAAQAENIRQAATLSVAALHRADQDKLATATAEADKETAKVDKQLKADLKTNTKPAKSKAAKAPKAKAARKTGKKAAEKPATSDNT